MNGWMNGSQEEECFEEKRTSFSLTVLTLGAASLWREDVPVIGCRLLPPNYHSLHNTFPVAGPTCSLRTPCCGLNLLTQCHVLRTPLEDLLVMQHGIQPAQQLSIGERTMFPVPRSSTRAVESSDDLPTSTQMVRNFSFSLSLTASLSSTLLILSSLDI